MTKSKAAQELGSRGGKVGGVVRALKLTPDARKRIAQRAARKRWGHNGEDYASAYEEIERRYREEIATVEKRRREALDAIEYLRDKCAPMEIPTDEDAIKIAVQSTRLEEIKETLRGKP